MSLAAPVPRLARDGKGVALSVQAVVLVVIIGVWAIIIGIMQIVAAIQLRQRIEGEWALGLAGLGVTASAGGA